MFAVTAVAVHPDDPLTGLRLGEHPEPAVAPGWEVVTVRAAALNHHDLWTLRGVGIDPARLPIVLGCDGAGVTEDGREVLVHALITEPGQDGGPGHRSILSERFDGTLATRVAAPRANLVDKPAWLSFEEAACLPTAWLTAYRMLFTRAALQPGQRVLIQGAGGGVSTAAILLARAAGLHVSVTSRAPDRLESALALGAHEAVPTGGRLLRRVHAVIETVGEATWEHSLKALEPDGVIVVAGATTGAAPPADLRRVFARQLRVMGSTMGSRGELEGLLAFLEVSGVRPVIADVSALDRAREAFACLADGNHVGKLVLRP